MKIWLAVGLAAVLGLGAGVGTAVVRVEVWRPWDGTPEGTGTHKAHEPEPSGLKAEVYVKDDTHDFGAIDSNAKVRHTFLFTNVGQAPLTLEEGRKSCKCAITILQEEEIPPGASVEVAIEWTGKRANYVGSFVQTAAIRTNDPTRREVTLTIKGRVTLAVKADLPGLKFGSVTVGESSSAEVRVFGYRAEFRKEPLAITGYELLKPGTKEHFEVAVKPLPPEEVKEEQDATSGVLAEVTLKPGLPVGAFEQTVLLKTNCKEAPTIEIPVHGRIIGEIRVVGGRGWFEDRGVLSLGRIRSRDGAQRTVFIRAGGQHYKKVHLEPVEKVPDLLQLKLEEPKVDDDSRVSVTRLTIQIPKGCRPVDHWGWDKERLGRITLRTNHPKAPELRIFLRFVVEG